MINKVETLRKELDELIEKHYPNNYDLILKKSQELDEALNELQKGSQ